MASRFPFPVKGLRPIFIYLLIWAALLSAAGLMTSNILQSGVERHVERIVAEGDDPQKFEERVSALRGDLHKILIAILLTAFLAGSALVFSLTSYFRKKIRAVVRRTEELAPFFRDSSPQRTRDDPLDRLGETLQRITRSLEKRFTEVEDEKKKLSVILDNMADGVIALNPRCQVLMINRGARAMFAAGHAGAEARSLIEMTHNTAIEKMAVACMERRGIVSGEIRISHPESKYLEVHAIGLEETAQGNGMSAILILHDVTPLRRLENIRREFVANVTHELKTPLTSIQGFAETLLGGAVEDPGKRDSFLKIIQEDAGRLNRLIQDILEISKLESREIRLKLKPVSLARVLRQVLRILGSQMEEKKITLENRIEEGDSAWVLGDEDRLKQVFINLIENAIKFNREQGRIILSAAKIEPDGVGVTVEDTGIGIPREHLPRIFERFYRVDKARSRQLGGTGLGLSIVKHIVEAHGGKISCESRVDQGTRFSLILKSAPAPAKAS